VFDMPDDVPSLWAAAATLNPKPAMVKTMAEN